jgi:hypothetical protein
MSERYGTYNGPDRSESNQPDKTTLEPALFAFKEPHVWVLLG